MQTGSDKGYRSSRDGNRGFTLIELLVVVAIIGILAAIALPSYLEFRKKAYDARCLSDIGNAIRAEEAYFAVHYSYISVGPVLGPARIDVPGFTVSDCVTLEVNAEDPSEYRITAECNKGTGTEFGYNSATSAFTRSP